MSLPEPPHLAEQPYTRDELLSMRREALCLAKVIPPGPERNQHRQVAISLRSLLRNASWLKTHTIDGQ